MITVKYKDDPKLYLQQYYQLNKRRAYAQNRGNLLKRKFGMTFEDVDRLRTKQHNKCAICTTNLKSGYGTQIDHCHNTNRVRGLLCPNCNKGLGLFKDDESVLQKAIIYLKLPEEPI